MRKKYLSALLFGALLFASAGTFTSCKDYDDDINNLQEQINTINTTLEELTSKINGLGAGVTDFKYENGKLVIVTDKGTNFEVTLPEADGIKELEIKDGILYADGEKVGVVAGEGGAVNVEVKDGILYINGEAQELNDEVGSKVVVVDNGNGTYTLTVDGTSIVLPKASASVAISIIDENKTNKDTYFFTNLTQGVKDAEENVATKGGILWSTADLYKEGTWKGLKPVTKGQLLVGQIRTIQVSVSPATFDLETAKLTLVNTLGEEAPVTVIPTAQGKFGPAISGSRAADANGVWDLSIEMKETVTVDNIATAFAAKDANNDYGYKNVKYALAVDGKVVTGYNIYVDTKETKSTESLAALTSLSFKFKENGSEKTLDTDNLPLGDTKLYVDKVDGQTGADKVYDAYIEIVDQDMADTYGITVNGMTISASQSAGSLQNFPIKIHVLDIRGNELVSNSINVNFEKSTQSGSEITAQEYKVMPTSAAAGAFVLVNLGETFTSLSADDAHKISNQKEDAVNWYTTTDANTFAVTGNALDGGIKLLSANAAIKYYASQEDALKDAMTGEEVDENGDKLAIKVAGGDATTIRTIKYAAIPVSAFKTDAKVGVNDLTIILEGTKDGRKNEIKRATTKLTVTIPTFDEVLEANAEQNLWNEAKDTYSTRVKTTSNKVEATFAKPYISKKDANGVQYIDLNKADGQLKYELTYKDFDNKPQLAYADVNESVELTGKIVKDHKLIEEVNAEATLYPFGNQYENLKVTKTFKVDVMSIFEGASLSYYVGGTKVDGAMTLEQYRYIYAGRYDDKGKPSSGLFITYDGETHPYALYGDNTFTNGITILKQVDANIKIKEADLTYSKSGDDKSVKPFIYLNDGAAASTLDMTQITVDKENRGVLDLGTVADGTSGTVKFTFVDNMDVYYTVSLNYKK